MVERFFSNWLIPPLQHLFAFRKLGNDQFSYKSFLRLCALVFVSCYLSVEWFSLNSYSIVSIAPAFAFIAGMFFLNRPVYLIGIYISWIISIFCANDVGLSDPLQKAIFYITYVSTVFPAHLLVGYWVGCQRGGDQPYRYKRYIISVPLIHTAILSIFLAIAANIFLFVVGDYGVSIWNRIAVLLLANLPVTILVVPFFLMFNNSQKGELSRYGLKYLINLVFPIIVAVLFNGPDFTQIGYFNKSFFILALFLIALLHIALIYKYNKAIPCLIAWYFATSYLISNGSIYSSIGNPNLTIYFHHFFFSLLAVFSLLVAQKTDRLSSFLKVYAKNRSRLSMNARKWRREASNSLRNMESISKHNEYLLHYDKDTGLKNELRCQLDIERYMPISNQSYVIGVKIGAYELLSRLLPETKLQALVLTLSRDILTRFNSFDDNDNEFFSEAYRLRDDVLALFFNGRSKSELNCIISHLTTFFSDNYKFDNVIIKPNLHFYGASSADAKYPKELILNLKHCMRSEPLASTCLWFGSSERISVDRKVMIERFVSKLVVDDSVVPMFQPIYSVSNGKLCGFEAFARITDGELYDTFPPNEFMPIADELGISSHVGIRLVEQFFANYELFKSFSEDVFISINVSPQQLFDDRFIACLMKNIHYHSVPAGKLRLEIKPNDFDLAPKQLSEMCCKLTKNGIVLVCDGFNDQGIDLNYFNIFGFKYFKLPADFSNCFNDGERGLTAISLISQVINLYGAELIVKNIEDFDVLSKVKLLNVSYIQGFALCQPLRLEEVQNVKNYEKKW